MKSITPIIAALVLGGCAAVTLTDEVDDLKTSSDDFQTSLKALGKGVGEGLEADQRSAVHQLVANGAPVVLIKDCLTKANGLAQAYDDTLDHEPYSPAASDAAYRALQKLRLCDFENITANEPPTDDALGKLEPGTGNLTGATVGADTLPGAAKALGDYVDALADLAGAKTSAGQDKARTTLFSAGGALLTATKVSNGAPIAGVVGTLLNSIAIAQRNKRIRDYLQAYDAIMPFVMERVGTAGRMAAAQSISNRTAAAEHLARNADRLLNDPAYLGTGASRPMRLELYRDFEARLVAENTQLRALRSADPMAAARAFAKAHNDLTVAYASKRANTEAAVGGLKDFNDAAATLVEALTKKD